MGVCDIILYPSNKLRMECSKVGDFGNSLDILVQDMKDTLLYEDGLGLAAPQIDAPLRVAMIDLSKTDHEGAGILVMINPEILEKEGEEEFQEGCLSIPGVSAKIKRPVYTKIRAKNVKGELFEFEARGYLSAAINHEIDHLNGVLIPDHLSPLKKKLFLKKARKNR